MEQSFQVGNKEGLGGTIKTSPYVPNVWAWQRVEQSLNSKSSMGSSPIVAEFLGVHITKAGGL